MKKINISALSFIVLLFSILKSDCNIENAFPNLSFEDPVGIYHAGDNSNRLFVLEQQGQIKVFANDESASNAQTFLDI